MDAYTSVKWLHVLGAAILFGTGLGTAFHFWLAWRSGRIAAIAAAARATVLADFCFIVPAVIVQPVSGFALAEIAGYPLASSWIVISIALYLLIGACWIPVVFIQMRMRDLAERLLADAGMPDPALERLARIWFLLGWPAFIATGAIFWLMIARPA